MSPSAAHLNTLYAVAFNASNSNGYLFAIDVTNGIPSVRTSFTFIGRSGASPVVVKPTQSGLTSPLVLLHSPEATTASQAKHRLLGLLDNGIQILPAWSLSLNQSMSVAPAFDQTSRSIYVQADNGPTLLRVDINTGRVLNTYNIKSIGAFPLGFKLNGHLVATRSSTGFTLLLSGSVGQGTQIGQHVMAFAPLVNAKKLLWRQKIFASPEEYTGAWNLAPASSQSKLFCPVVMGPLSGLTLLCD